MGDATLRSSQVSGVADNIRTDVFCCNYENLILVIITQHGKLGTMIHVKKEATLDVAEALPVYSTNVLLGEDDVLTNVVARNLASQIDSNKPILFNLALKDKSPAAVKGFSKLLSECKCW